MLNCIVWSTLISIDNIYTHIIDFMQQLKRKQSASFKASKRRQQILAAQKFDQELQQKEQEEKVCAVISSMIGNSSNKG